MKAVVAAFNQEKALVGAFSVITNLRMELFEALTRMQPPAAICCIIQKLKFGKPSSRVKPSYQSMIHIIGQRWGKLPSWLCSPVNNRASNEGSRRFCILLAFSHLRVYTPVYRGPIPRPRWSRKRTYREGVCNHTGHSHGVVQLCWRDKFKDNPQKVS